MIQGRGEGSSENEQPREMSLVREARAGTCSENVNGQRRESITESINSVRV